MPAAITVRAPGRPTAGAVRGGPATPTAVPWTTVLTLAGVLAFADGFWLTSLRGAVGAIQRTQSPFTSWLRESTILLPAFAVAVLGALTLALRWFGPHRGERRAVPVTGLLVAAAGTLVGLAETSVNAVYDYRLQTSHLQMMDSMRSLCTGSCLSQARHATLLVHVHGVLYLGRWLLLTNVVLVAWLVAIWRGRLPLSTDRPCGGRPAPRKPVRDRTADWRTLLIAALLAGATVEAAAVPARINEDAGLLSLILAIWGVALAGLLLAGLDERIMLLATAAVSGGALLLSVGGGIVGVSPAAGAHSLTGLTATALQVLTLVASLTPLRSQRPSVPKPRLPAHGRALIATTMLALTLIGVAGTGPSWFDAFGIAHNQAQDHTAH